MVIALIAGLKIFTIWDSHRTTYTTMEDGSTFVQIEVTKKLDGQKFAPVFSTSLFTEKDADTNRYSIKEIKTEAVFFRAMPKQYTLEPKGKMTVTAQEEGVRYLVSQTFDAYKETVNFGEATFSALFTINPETGKITAEVSQSHS